MARLLWRLFFFFFSLQQWGLNWYWMAATLLPLPNIPGVWPHWNHIKDTNFLLFKGFFFPPRCVPSVTGRRLKERRHEPSWIPFSAEGRSHCQETGTRPPWSFGCKKTRYTGRAEDFWSRRCQIWEERLLLMLSNKKKNLFHWFTSLPSTFLFMSTVACFYSS